MKLKIVRDLKKGWGLHADQFVKKGEFICEYAGINSFIQSLLITI